MIGTESRVAWLGSAVFTVAALMLIAAPAASAEPELARATVFSGGVDIQPTQNFKQAFVSVSGNGVLIQRTLEAGADISISVFDLEGELLPDGRYTWRVELVPSDDIARQLRIEATQNEGVAPNAWQPETGTFTISGGVVASPDFAELSSSRETTGLPSSAPLQSGLQSGFARSEAAVDDDSAVGFRVGVEDAMRAAGPQDLVPTGRQLLERSDAGALALGASLEQPLAPLTQPVVPGAAEAAPRSISPDGKNGRPRSRDELR